MFGRVPKSACRASQGWCPLSRLLDVPWVVNEEAERISTHGGLGSIDFNGAEKERREAMRLVAQTQAMAHALLAQGYTDGND